MICSWCKSARPNARSAARYCSTRCRQAAHRFNSGAVERERAQSPLRLAYADPPYPGLAYVYRDHPVYAGEVDHYELLSRLQVFDGWALSTSARALPEVCSIAVALGSAIRVAAWVRGGRSGRSRWPVISWEPVVFAGGRRLPATGRVDDSLIRIARPRTTDVNRVIGAKPAAFCYWMFDLLGALPGDEFTDLYPGSGGVARAWDVYASKASCSAGDDG